MKTLIAYTASLALATLCTGTIIAGTATAQTQTTTSSSRDKLAMPEHRDTRMFNDMDTNKDDMISREEYVNYYAVKYDRWDGPRKGKMSRDEMKTRMLEGETSKSDGNPMGNSLKPGSVQR